MSEKNAKLFQVKKMVKIFNLLTVFSILFYLLKLIKTIYYVHVYMNLHWANTNILYSENDTKNMKSVCVFNYYVYKYNIIVSKQLLWETAQQFCLEYHKTIK